MKKINKYIVETLLNKNKKPSVKSTDKYFSSLWRKTPRFTHYSYNIIDKNGKHNKDAEAKMEKEMDKKCMSYQIILKKIWNIYL